MSDELGFGSKVDIWLLVVALSAVAACLWILLTIWQDVYAVDSLAAILLAIPLVAGVLVPLWLIVSIRYFLSNDTLRVRCGPFRWRIPVRDITAVEPTQSMRSSPSMSTERLRIDYGDGRSVMISPEPREEFVRQLEHRRKEAAAA
jgi:hypothetical protein